MFAPDSRLVGRKAPAFDVHRAARLGAPAWARLSGDRMRQMAAVEQEARSNCGIRLRSLESLCYLRRICGHPWMVETAVFSSRSRAFSGLRVPRPR
jgi:hypothetical protein